MSRSETRATTRTPDNTRLVPPLPSVAPEEPAVIRIRTGKAVAFQKFWSNGGLGGRFTSLKRYLQFLLGGLRVSAFLIPEDWEIQRAETGLTRRRTQAVFARAENPQMGEEGNPGAQH